MWTRWFRTQARQSQGDRLLAQPAAGRKSPEKLAESRRSWDPDEAEAQSCEEPEARPARWRGGTRPVGAMKRPDSMNRKDWMSLVDWANLRQRLLRVKPLEPPARMGKRTMPLSSANRQRRLQALAWSPQEGRREPGTQSGRQADAAPRLPVPCAAESRA